MDETDSELDGQEQQKFHNGFPYFQKVFSSSTLNASKFPTAHERHGRWAWSKVKYACAKTYPSCEIIRHHTKKFLFLPDWSFCRRDRIFAFSNFGFVSKPRASRHRFLTCNRVKIIETLPAKQNCFVLFAFFCILVHESTIVGKVFHLYMYLNMWVTLNRDTRFSFGDIL